jgi:hypothetical protein
VRGFTDKQCSRRPDNFLAGKNTANLARAHLDIDGVSRMYRIAGSAVGAHLFLRHGFLQAVLDYIRP